MEDLRDLYCGEDEDREIKYPYWRVMYIDDYGHKHIAMINDDSYLAYIKDRYIVVDCKLIEE